MTGYIAKPPFITGLDKSNPLAQDISLALPMGENATNAYIRDFSGNENHGVPQNYTDITKGSGPYGANRQWSGTGDSIDLLDQTKIYLNDNKPWTLSWIMNPDSSWSGLNPDFYILANFTTNTTESLNLWFNKNVQYRYLFWGNNSYVSGDNFQRFKVVDSELLNSLDKYTVNSIVFDGVDGEATSSMKFYQDGKEYTVYLGGVSTGNPSQYCNTIGDRNFSSSAPMIGFLENFVIHDRALNHNEIASFHHNPYQIYKTADTLSSLVAGTIESAGSSLAWLRRRINKSLLAR